MHFKPWLLGTVCILIVGSVVWATTHHELTVDGDLSDFAPDEKTAGDPSDDSNWGPTNELSNLYVTWTDKKLYLGFEYQAENAAVMYLVKATGKDNGVTNFCASAGYAGAFPANVRVSDNNDAPNLLIALYAGATTNGPFVFTLQNNGSTDVTTAEGVAAKLSETMNGSAHNGRVEVGIPWSVIYGLGEGKVAQNAILKIVGVIRGEQDNDGLGDTYPDPKGGNSAIKSGNCLSGEYTSIDNLYWINVDNNSDGIPDKDRSPGPNTPAKVDGGSEPQPDTQSVPDTAIASDMPSSGEPDVQENPSDMNDGDDQNNSGDLMVEETGVQEDLSTMDDFSFRWSDARRTRNTAQDEGCSCSIASEPAGIPVGLLFLIVGVGGIIVIRRRAK